MAQLVKEPVVRYGVKRLCEVQDCSVDLVLLVIVAHDVLECG